MYKMITLTFETRTEIREKGISTNYAFQNYGIFREKKLKWR